jgi:hypothetical protein
VALNQPRAPRTRLPRRLSPEKPPRRAPRPRLPPREVARIIDEGDKTLVDVLDSLLNQGVVLNADLVLALADVDLVYVRLSALICAADRVLPGRSDGD